jgi:hypothetical protein
MDYLSSLPDELILEILGHMRPAKTYRQATEGKDIYGPGIGSELSQKCLHSLCLTSKRIGAITTPELYANLQGGTGRFHSNGIERLVKYTKMILNKPILRNHLVYIKHRFDWGYGHGVWPYTGDKEGCEWSDHSKTLKLAASQIWPKHKLQVWVELFWVHPEQASIVLLLALAPNISHIVVDIFDAALPSIVALLDLDYLQKDSQDRIIHGFVRLKTALFYSRHNFDDVNFPQQADFYTLLLQALQGFPSLNPYQHSAA